MYFLFTTKTNKLVIKTQFRFTKLESMQINIGLFFLSNVRTELADLSKTFQ